MTIRALVVDDSAIFRKIISETIAAMPGMEVVGTAGNGAIALGRISALRPDVVLLDIEMPEMDGFDVLQAIRSQKLDVGVIMVSAFTRRGGQMTIRALELGAFDFITKATEGTAEENRRSIQESLGGVMKAFSRRHEIRSILKGSGVPSTAERPAETRVTAPPASPVQRQIPEAASNDLTQRMERLAGRSRASMILIGVSTGGPNALSQILPHFPPDLNVPIFIVQHMPPMFTRSLAESLNERCQLRVKEASHAEIAVPNQIYLAPGGKHMKIGPGQGSEIMIQITDDPPENNCRPSVDTLFRSAAHAFPGRACAVIMTGMGSDGTLGLRLLKRGGCTVIAQDEASCVVFGMPKEAIDAGVVDIITPLDRIPIEVHKAVKGF
jgi:two-component system, chemotaxis family, protein-glutamate methylesterase/glutaminase